MSNITSAWIWPSQEGLNLASPNQFHDYQDAFGVLNGISLRDVYGVLPCPCEGCRE